MSSFVEPLARIGYAAKGVVYVIVGGLAVQAARSPVERPEGSTGALEVLLRQPFGKVLLGAITIGLAAYVLWRIVQAVVDPDRKGTDAKGLLIRAGYALSALLHAGLTVAAVRMLLDGVRSEGGGGGAQDWTAKLMAQPFGPWLVGGVGVGILLFGLYELYRAATYNVNKRLDTATMRTDTRRRISLIGKAGLAARGVVFGLIGLFVVQAALRFNPQRAAGLPDALSALREQPFGPWLLGLVAFGLIAHGLFLFVKARYRRMRV